MSNDTILAVLALLGLAGIVAFAFTRRPATSAPALMAAPSGGGWHNEEIVDVIRGNDGFIEKLVVHRSVEVA